MSQTNKNNIYRAETVELLENTIARLNSILAELRTNREAQLPPRTSLQNLATTTEDLAKLLQVNTTATKEDTTEEKIELTGLDRILPSFSSLDFWWNSIISKVHAVFPLSRKISDLGLTGIITGIMVVLLLGSVLFFSQPSQQVEQIRSRPQEVIKKPSSLTETSGGEKQAAKQYSPPIEPQTETNQRKIVTPNPQLELTPEQTLIAGIQKQVAEITGQYADGLILSIEANFISSRLIVRVGDVWYGLTGRRQEQLANEIFERSQQLDFRKLELIDLQNNLLARSPVVGKNMVILQR
jgi:hypothetical protein